MPEKLATAIASLGSFEGKDGKKHAKKRTVSYIYQHSDGRCFMAMDAAFDYGRIPIPRGSDVFYFELEVPKGLMLDLVERPSR